MPVFRRLCHSLLIIVSLTNALLAINPNWFLAYNCVFTKNTTLQIRHKDLLIAGRTLYRPRAVSGKADVVAILDPDAAIAVFRARVITTF